MSAKDVIVEVLSASRTTYTIEDDIVVVEPIVLEEDFEKVADQILDSLPRLSRDKVKEVLVKNMTKEIIEYDENGNKAYMGKELDWDRVITDICSLIPAGEVVATGEVLGEWHEWGVRAMVLTEDGAGVYPNDVMLEKEGQSGTLIWVPDKEDK